MGYVARILGIFLGLHLFRTVLSLILSSFSSSSAYHYPHSIILIVFCLPVSFVLCGEYNFGGSTMKDAVLIMAAIAYNAAIIYDLIATAPGCQIPCYWKVWHKIRFLMSIVLFGFEVLCAMGFLLRYFKKRYFAAWPQVTYQLPPEHHQDLNTSSQNQQHLDIPNFVIDAPPDEPFPYSDNTAAGYIEKELSSISSEIPPVHVDRVSVDPQFMLKTMECRICMQHYNTRHRLPKAMRCQHTLCQICINKLVTNGYITCPQCREFTEKEDVRTNYALKDILEGLCEVCFSHQRNAKCEHCRHQLCKECLQDHSMMPKQDTLARHCSLSDSGTPGGAVSDTEDTPESASGTPGGVVPDIEDTPESDSGTPGGVVSDMEDTPESDSGAPGGAASETEDTSETDSVF